MVLLLEFVCNICRTILTLRAELSVEQIAVTAFICASLKNLICTLQRATSISQGELWHGWVDKV